MWSPTSALVSGDQSVDPSCENESLPRARGARLRPSRAGFWRSLGPGPRCQNQEFRMSYKPLRYPPVGRSRQGIKVLMGLGRLRIPLSGERHFGAKTGVRFTGGVRSRGVEGSGLRSPMGAPTFLERGFGHPSRAAGPVALLFRVDPTKHEDCYPQ
jgi:hypothetical protein